LHILRILDISTESASFLIESYSYQVIICHEKCLSMVISIDYIYLMTPNSFTFPQGGAFSIQIV